MAEDEDIVVKIDQETPAEGERVAPEADPVAELKAQYQELEGERERERTEREAAQRREESERSARIAAEHALDAGRTEIADSRLATIEQGIAAAQTSSEAAKAEIATAQEAGDWKRVADAHEKLADARADLKMLAQGKSDLEAGKAEPRQEQRRQAPADPLEAFLQGRTAPTANWLRSHPDELRALATNSDSRRVAKISAAHNDALAEGYGLDSSEYFAHVERFLGMTKEEKKEEAKPAGNGVAKAARRSGPTVAPVQASGGGVSGDGVEVRLSKGEAAAATDGTLVWNYNDPSGKGLFKKGDPIGTTEMARRKKAMSDQGLYDKSWTQS